MNLKTSSIVVGIWAVCLAATARQTPPKSYETWTWRNPLPTGNQLSGITYGNSLFVAVGEDSAILTSPDGTNWGQQIAPPNNSLSGVAAGPRQFVAVGVDAITFSTNVILNSPDGTNWSAITESVGAGGLLAVAYGSGVYLAVGNGGSNWFSSDGINWNQGPAQGTDLNSVSYGNGVFLAVGDGGSIYTTANGTSWTLQGSGVTSDDLYGVAWGPPGFVAVGEPVFLYSADGTNWINETSNTFHNVAYYANDAVYGDGMYVVGNTSSYYPASFTSTDGMNWTLYDGVWLFDALAYGNGTFIGVGQTFANSTDGTTNWNTITSSVPTGTLRAVVNGTTAGGTNLFVVGGSSSSQQLAVLTSTNGFKWGLDTNSSINSGVEFYNAYINGLAYGTDSSGGREFVATVNTAGGFLSYNSIIMSSSDGIVWVTNYALPFSTGITLNAVTYGTTGGGTPYFVAVGTRGAVAYSSDGSTWTTNSSGTNGTLAAVTFGAASGGPQFVAVGSFGATATSTDAIHWTANSDGDTNQENLNGVACGNGMFVAVGSAGVIFTSTDGAAWTSQTSGTTTDFSGVTFANGVFVAVAQSFGGGPSIFVSTNGTSWMSAGVSVQGGLYAAGFGQGQFITVGSAGAILGSIYPNFPASPAPSYDPVADILTFTVCSPPGTYGLYVSYNLIDWSKVQDVIFSSSAPCQTLNVHATSSAAYYALGSK